MCVPLGPLFWDFLKLSDHSVAVEDEVDIDESSEEVTEMMPPLPPASWYKKTDNYCGKFRKPRKGDHRDEESSFFDCWDWKHEQSDVLQQGDPWARNAPKSVPNVKSCLSENCPVCSVCRKLGEYQHLPIKLHSVTGEQEDRLDAFPNEVAPSDNSNDGEWWLGEVDFISVTIGNVSIDSKPVKMDGKRGRYRESTVDSGAGESRRLANSRSETVKGLRERTTICEPWR